MLLKTLERTIILEAWTNGIGRQVLREIEDVYRRMLQEMVEYAIEHKASQATLHKIFYHRFRREYPWLPTRIIKGCYRDAARRAKSFRVLRDRGVAKTDRPEVRKVTITFSDSQDWKLEDGVIELRTHRGWIELHYRGHRQLYRYLYGGWKLSKELKLKFDNGKLFVYLAFKKDFEVAYNPRNVVAVDINENNVTAAVFKEGKLSEVYRIETNLGKIVVAYSERKKKITRGSSTKARWVRKALKKLREKERKRDVVYKTARIIEKLAVENNAVVVVGNVHRGKKRLVENTGKNYLRHRIHQWSVSNLVKVLDSKPIHVVEVSEAYTSSIDPFTRKPIRKFSPSVIRYAVRGGKRVRVVKIVLRVAENGLDRDVIGAINIGLKYLSTDGSPVALGSTGPHAVWPKLVTPHQGPTPPTKICRSS